MSSWGATVALARDNNNGKTATLAPGEERAFLRGEPSDLDCRATVAATVALSAQPSAAVPAGEIFGVRARIQWRAGTAWHTILIDVGAGTQVCLPAEWVEINGVNVGSVVAHLSATLGFGTRSLTVPPTLTTSPEFLVDTAVGVAVEVPAFAAQALLIASIGGVANLRQYTDDAGTVLIATAFGGSLHPLTRSVRVENISGSDQSFSLQFSLRV